MKPPRALDPETHLPYPQLTLVDRVVRFFYRNYVAKYILVLCSKISSIAWIASYFGFTPSAQDAIGIGLSGLLLGILSWLISQGIKKLHLAPLPSLQEISEEIEKEELPTNEMNFWLAIKQPSEPLSQIDETKTEPVNTMALSNNTPNPVFTPRTPGNEVTPPIGKKGDLLVAFPKAEDPKSAMLKGKLLGEIDNLVVIETPEGEKLALGRDDYDLYVKV